MWRYVSRLLVSLAEAIPAEKCAGRPGLRPSDLGRKVTIYGDYGETVEVGGMYQAIASSMSLKCNSAPLKGKDCLCDGFTSNGLFHPAFG